MKPNRTWTCLALAAALGTLAVRPAPASADTHAAYLSERKAYKHEAALAAKYKHETVVQHRILVRLERQRRTSGSSAPSYGWGTL